MTKSERRVILLAGLSLLIVSWALLLAGCGKKDDAPPAGAGSYYTGPMAKKQGPVQPSGGAQ